MKTWTGRSWQRVICCVLALVQGATLAGEKAPALGDGEKVRVSFNLLVTPSEGATSRRATFGPFDLDAGQSLLDGTRFFALAAGGGPHGCNSGVSTLPLDTLFGSEYGYSVGWTADAKVQEASMAWLLLAASWKRFGRDRNGELVVLAEESIPRLSLREGDHVLLDYVPSPGGAGPCARNYALELTAEVSEDPAMTGRQIAYDVWLVHETADGRTATERAQITAKHGEKSAFAFPNQKLPAGARPGESLHVSVSGHLRGRIRKDGTVELVLETTRALSYVAAGGSSDGYVSESGEKVVRVEMDEAVRVELPAPDQGPTGQDPRGAHMARDLAAHTFAVILTAKPL